MTGGVLTRSRPRDVQPSISSANEGPRKWHQNRPFLPMSCGADHFKMKRTHPIEMHSDQLAVAYGCAAVRTRGFASGEMGRQRKSGR